MLAPPFGDTDVIRALERARTRPCRCPTTSARRDFNGTQFFDANGTLNEQPWILRKHQAFRPVDDPAFFYS